ncbi:MAG: hybrid sensor histidine kinase/response regulator [Acidobacteria bacterium]|nr:MAG: hybrid sensor histidine kinase/response regulator [Acidobacteriota bacterium]PYQ19510.1 MAG: hybrid sensor histidine kinase/response regulator [Acidobacteriota bacterium]
MVRKTAPSTLPMAKAREDFLRLVEHVEDYAIFLLDADGRIASWNVGAECIKGYRADEVVGQHLSRFYTPEDVAAGRPAHALDVARREGVYRDEGWRLRKDGSRFWASIVLNALREPDGTLIGFLKITRDLTQRREAEDKLRQSEERFRLLVEAVTDYAVFMLDTSGHVVSWNPGAERIKGYRAGEIIGSHFSRFYPDADVKAGKPARELTIAAAEGRYEEEGWRVRKDGTLFWASVIITPLRDEGGRLRGFAKVTRDLTGRHEAEEQRLALAREQAARVEAEKANQIKDEFMAVLSHELRTPLNAIVGWAQVIRSSPGLPADQFQRGLDAIHRNAAVQAQIVGDVLDISRITTGKVRMSPRRVDAREIVAAAAETLRLAAEAKRLDLRASTPGEPVFIWADPDRIQQVVWNLLSNAVKFTPPAGRVELTLATRDAHAEITVTDTGAGIRPEFLPHVFESFRQADSSSSRAHGGLGLGLAIVKQLVELHGGEVEAHSEGQGRGATLRVRLPLSPDETIVPARGPGAVRLDGVSVLVVEDNDDARELVTVMLGQLGAAVLCASGAAEGLALVREKRPDVIVSDIELPAGSGYELMQMIRAMPPAIGGLTPAVALTAYARAEDRVRALGAGFDAHVAKPARSDELALAIASLVGRDRR